MNSKVLLNYRLPNWVHCEQCRLSSLLLPLPLDYFVTLGAYRSGQSLISFSLLRHITKHI